MVEAEVRHGEEIRADLPGIRVGAVGRSWLLGRSTGPGEVFFCNMGAVAVRQKLAPGDGGPLPGNVVVQGLEVPNEGTYDLIDVLIQSNGDLRVILDGASRAVPARVPAALRRSDPMYV
jgi:hypothetical protein